MVGLEGVKKEVIKLKKALLYSSLMSLVGILGLMGAVVVLMGITADQMEFIVELQEQINLLKQ